IRVLDENKGLLTAFDWTFLAMAHHRLGHAEKAREFRDRALVWTEKALRETTRLPATDRAMNVNDRLEILILLREAVSLIAGDSQKSMDTVAFCFNFLKLHAEALKLHERTLQLRTAKLGPDHPDTLKSMKGTAATLIDLHRENDAL